MSDVLNGSGGVPERNRPIVWWVNQGQTYAKERDGSYIWAPQKTKSGTPASHHTAVDDVRRGDRIVHYAKGHIRAAGIAVSDGREQRRPDELSGDAWEVDGYSADVEYHELERPIPLAEIDISYREGGGGPFTAAGAVQQGYLFRVSDDVGQYLATLVDQGEPQPPKLWVVYVGQASVTNLRHSLPTGMWGWRHEQSQLRRVRSGRHDSLLGGLHGRESTDRSRRVPSGTVQRTRDLSRWIERSGRSHPRTGRMRPTASCTRSGSISRRSTSSATSRSAASTITTAVQSPTPSVCQPSTRAVQYSLKAHQAWTWVLHREERWSM